MISLYQYQLPFSAPLRTGAGDILSREGVLIRYQDKDLDLLSEASPLPGFSKENIDTVKKDLITIKSQLDSFLTTSCSIEQLNQFISGPASIQFAISDLARKVIQIRGGFPINHPLFQSEKRSVLVNDIVGYHDPETTKHLILSALDSGFKTIKIKVPTPDPDLADVLREVSTQRVDVNFRLDANQNWDIQKLEVFNRLFKSLPIEYIEEPLGLHDDEEIERISTLCDYPIALDESISDMDHLTQLLKQHPNLFIIIKPMLLGNIFKLSETLSKYRSSYKRVVITSSLESAVGLETISLLATFLGDKSRAHGLNTGKLFRQDLTTDDTMKSEVIDLANRSGSAITMDQSLLTLL